MSKIIRNILIETLPPLIGVIVVAYLLEPGSHAQTIAVFGYAAAYLMGIWVGCAVKFLLRCHARREPRYRTAWATVKT